MRCAECGLYECCMRTPLGGCPYGEKVDPAEIITTTNTGPVSLPNGPWDKGYEPADIVRKNAEPPVSREEFERRKKVWKAHERIVLEPFLEAAQDLVDAVERYTRQECLRSELMMKKDKLKELVDSK